MNMKLMTALAVAITLASAMTFVGLSGKASKPSAEPKAVAPAATTLTPTVAGDGGSEGPEQIETRLNTSQNQVITTLKIK